MENHGPLHLEAITADERNAFFSQPTTAADDNLAVYLRHLKNADQMLNRLTGYLKDQDPAAVLAWYGDHVPGMPDIYRPRNYQDPCTDYLIWSAGRASQTPCEPIESAVETLAGRLLDATHCTKEPCR
jgi:hypothetical protein